MSQSFSESWNMLPSVNTGTIGNVFGSHPIVKMIASQIAQDTLNTIEFKGEADTVKMLRRKMSRDGWTANIFNAIYQSLYFGNSYLILDYGDSGAKLKKEPQTGRTPKPLKVVHNIPTIKDFDNRKGENTSIHSDRFVEFVSPYPYQFGSELQVEMLKHDRLLNGIMSQVEGAGLITIGIEELWEVLISSGAKEKLSDRLIRLKQANSGNGVLAYDKNRESVDIIPKTFGRESDTLKIVENRITAMTGLPSFVIWGNGDSAEFGVKSSLQLYSQRIISQAEIYLIPNMIFILDLLDQPDIDCDTKTIFPDSNLDRSTAAEKIANSLVALQSIGAMTSIEVRNTVVSDNLMELVLDPNATTVQINPTQP